MTEGIETFLDYLGIRQDFENFLRGFDDKDRAKAFMIFLEERGLSELYKKWLVEKDRKDLIG